VTLAQLLKTAEREDGERLHEESYAGGAFMTGALSHGSGLAQGFDTYAEIMMGHPRVDLESRWSIFRARLALPSLAFKLAAKRNPDYLIDTARDWIEEHAKRRFFAFVHLYSTHTPYDPPEPYRSAYVDPGYDGPIQSFYADTRRAIERGEYVPDDADKRQVYDLYLGGVALADHHIGLVMEDLERLGIGDDTLVIVTSDHGEDFGEGGRWEHSHMYRSNLHVPLVMRWPGGLPAGRRIPAAVESVDIVPTLADLFGLRFPEARSPRDEVDGRSLVPLIEGDAEVIKPFTFAEDATFVSISDERYMLALERYAVKPDGWQIALDERRGQVRFHDLERDPLQSRDLFRDIVRGDPARVSESAREQVLAQVNRLRAALLAWNADMPIDVEDVVLSDRDLENERLRAQQDPDYERQMANLQSLGYTETGDRTSYVGDLAERVRELRGEERPGPQ
jgi:arylsulfatase A-like enzyme